MSTRQPPSLRWNVGWAVLGTAGYAGCQWAIVVLLAKLGSAEAVGRFAFALALTGPIMILANLNLRAVQATDARGEYPFGIYLGVRLLTVAAALAVIAATALGLGERGPMLATVLLLGVAKGFESVSDVIFGLLQQAENLKRITLSMLLKGALSVGAVAAVLHLGGDVVLATLVLAVVWGAMLVAYDLPSAARLAAIRPRFAWRPLAGLAWLALPIGCVLGLNSFTTNLPRYAIERHLGAAALGHFAALAYLFVAGNQPVLALGAAVTPRLARHFVSDRRAYRELVRRTLFLTGALGVIGVAGAACLGHRVLALAYAPEYAAHARVLVWLAVAAGVGFTASAFGYSVTAARRFRAQFVVAVLSFGGCLVASQLLIPRYGLLGAAWALLTSEAIRVTALGLVYAGARGARVPGLGRVAAHELPSAAV